jgi:hypothetical protein
MTTVNLIVIEVWEARGPITRPKTLSAEGQILIPFLAGAGSGIFPIALSLMCEKTTNTSMLK